MPPGGIRTTISAGERPQAARLLRSQTAQFYYEHISTDLNLVTWQSTVHEPPEDGLKNGTETCRGKFLSIFNVNFSAFLKCI